MEMFFSPFIIPVVAILAGAATVIARGPIGQALARRIGGDVPSGDHHELQGEIDALVERLTDVEERMDFAERLLSKESPPRQIRDV